LLNSTSAQYTVGHSVFRSEQIDRLRLLHLDNSHWQSSFRQCADLCFRFSSFCWY